MGEQGVHLSQFGSSHTGEPGDKEEFDAIVADPTHRHLRVRRVCVEEGEAITHLARSQPPILAQRRRVGAQQMVTPENALELAGMRAPILLDHLLQNVHQQQEQIRSQRVPLLEPALAG